MFFFNFETNDSRELRGNKGEWSELYSFLKILTDGRVYAADVNYNKIPNVFLSVLSIIREEVAGNIYRYCTGDNIVIKLNGNEVGQVPRSEFASRMDIIWNKLSSVKGKSSFEISETEDFLKSVHINKIKSPAAKSSEYFGGTIDITLQTITSDNVERVMGFSCKSEISAASTLFNASGDNTNFLFEVTGNITDDVMNHFNSLFKEVSRKGETKYDIATHDRMEYLKEVGCNIEFVSTVRSLANENLIRCGGLELPAIIAGMLKCFYYNNSGSRVSVLECINWLAQEDIANYGFSDLYETYYAKVANFLYCSFTGLRLGSRWNGRAEVNGGYIVVKRDGEVVAYHSTIADEFKDFLVHRLTMEAPSHSRHKDMVIEKMNGKYYLKLGLQLRFSMN